MQPWWLTLSPALRMERLCSLELSIAPRYIFQGQMKQALGKNHLFLATVTLIWFLGTAFFAEANPSTSRKFKETALGYFENYCFDCHDGETKKGDLDLASLLEKGGFDGSLIFEHLIAAKPDLIDGKENCPKIRSRRIGTAEK